MKLQELRPAEGSTQSVKRVGRGTGSGLGSRGAAQALRTLHNALFP